MSYMDQREKAKHTEIRQRHAAKVQDIQFANDVRNLFRHEGNRRVFNRFFAAMGVDGSPFNTNAMAQSRAIGLHDAARWWIDNIRDLCPEQEVTMRTEAATSARDALKLAESAEIADDAE